MKRIFTYLTILLSAHSFGQQLSFSDVGSEPAYCRIYSFQSGNGVVYASAQGGTPNYTYQWTNLSTGATTTNTTWGGLNPGDYEIKAWDAAGDSIMQVVTLDSVNPIAAISVEPGVLQDNHPHYQGASPATVIFHNESQYYANPNNPNSQELFFWRFTQFENWYVSNSASESPGYIYNYGGDWGVDLVAVNKNGCTDTATIYIHLAGTSDIDEEVAGDFRIISNSSANQLVIDAENTNSEYSFRVYDLSGKLIMQETVVEDYTMFNFEEKGIFVYEIVDLKNQEKVESGKFMF